MDQHQGDSGLSFESGSSQSDGPPLRVGRPMQVNSTATKLPAWWFDGIRLKKGTVPVLAAAGIVVLGLLAWQAGRGNSDVVADSELTAQAVGGGSDTGEANNIGQSAADGDSRASGSFTDGDDQAGGVSNGGSPDTIDLGISSEVASPVPDDTEPPATVKPTTTTTEATTTTTAETTTTTAETTTTTEATTTTEESTTTTEATTTTVDNQPLPDLPPDAVLLVNVASGLCASSAGLDSLANISVQQCELVDTQIYRLVAAGPGVAVINIASELALDISGASRAEDGQLILYRPHLAENQQWISSNTDTGQSLISINSNMCLHATSSGNVVQRICNQRGRQSWRFVPASSLIN